MELEKLEEVFTTNFYKVLKDENGRVWMVNSSDILLPCHEAAEIGKFCMDYLSHADPDFVDDYNEKVLTHRREVRKQEEKDIGRQSRQTRKQTFIYLLKNQRTRLYKIGRSNDPRYRESTLQGEEPEIDLLFFFLGTSQTEATLHAEYASKRVRGEWFRLTDADIEAIKILIPE